MRKQIKQGAVIAAAAGAAAVVGAVSVHAAQNPISINGIAAAANPAAGMGYGPPGGHGGPGMGDRAEDQQVIATAIGITTTQLDSELAGGKTIAQVAQAHGVAVDKVISALVAAETKEIDQRVSAGQMTQAQADHMKAGLQQRATDQVNGTGHGPGGPGHGGPGGPGRGGMQAEDQQLVADAIGITTAQLETELAGGKTIAQVVQAHGASVDALIAKWVASENKEIDDRVAAGQMTQVQADQAKAHTQQRVTDAVNGVHPAPPAGTQPPAS